MNIQAVGRHDQHSASVEPTLRMWQTQGREEVAREQV